MDRWAGKVAVVTGASAGIGASIVEELAKHGMKVVGLARRVDRVEALKKTIGDAKGEVYGLKADVCKEQDIIDAFKWVKEKFGAVHVLVNNAGGMKISSLSDGTTEQFRNTLELNVLGLTICTQQALKLMKESGVDDGHIFHINSLAGHRVPNLGAPVFNIYPASKFAVTALTESFRQELVFMKSKIRVTSISPGAVKTEFQESSVKGTAMEAQLEKMLASASISFLEPKDVTDALIFALGMPAHAQVHDILLRAIGQAT